MYFRLDHVAPLLGRNTGLARAVLANRRVALLTVAAYGFIGRPLERQAIDNPLTPKLPDMGAGEGIDVGCSRRDRVERREDAQRLTHYWSS